MSIYIYDCEVFAQDWLVVFKEVGSGEYTVIPNDAEKLLNFMGELDDIYVGFNSKNYDQFIIKAICTGLNREEIKAVNDFIIHGGNGWECPLLAESRFRFNNVDLMDDMQKGLSLKAIEGHLGMDIEETEVDFNLDRPLTDEEMALTIKYCKHDVDATEEVFKLRTGYIKNKLAVGRLAGIDDVKAMSMTNAKLTAAMLKAQPTPHDDERAYQYPSNLLRQYIPDEVFQYFDRMKDPNLSDEQVFGHKLDIEVGGCPVRIGFGGIHGAKKNYFFEVDTSTERHRVIENDDVGSYYPHLMTINSYTSRNIPSPKIFADVLESRMAAKKAGDKVKTNALKLVLDVLGSSIKNPLNFTRGVDESLLTGNTFMI